jgi:chromosome segregation ATPase
MGNLTSTLPAKPSLSAQAAGAAGSASSARAGPLQPSTAAAPPATAEENALESSGMGGLPSVLPAKPSLSAQAAAFSGSASSGRAEPLQPSTEAAPPATAEEYAARILNAETEVSKLKERLNNLKRKDPRLDWARKNLVKLGTMSLQEAVQQAREETSKNIGAKEAALMKLNREAKQAIGANGMIYEHAKLLPSVKANTDMLPKVVSEQERQGELLLEIRAGMRGELAIDPNADLEAGCGHIRMMKSRLTSQFQALQRAKKEKTLANVGEVIDELNERDSTLAAVKESMELQQETVKNLSRDIRLKNLEVKTAKLKNDRDEYTKLAGEVKELKRQLQVQKETLTSCKEGFKQQSGQGLVGARSSGITTAQRRKQCDVTDAKEKLDAAKARVKDLKNEMTECKDGCKTASKEVAGAKEAFGLNQAEVKALRKELAGLEADNDSSDKDSDQHDKIAVAEEIKMKLKEAETLQNELNTKAETCSAASEKLKKTDNDLVDAQTEMVKAEKSLAELQKELKVMRQFLVCFQARELPGITRSTPSPPTPADL